MGKLNMIFDSYLYNRNNFENTEEYKKADEELDSYIEKLALDFDKITELQELIIFLVSSMEQQSFINGFKYATNIWKECDNN